MKPRRTKWLWLALPGCMLLQFAGCFGGDPAFFLTSTVVNAVVFNLVSTLFNLVVSGLTTTATLLG